MRIPLPHEARAPDWKPIDVIAAISAERDEIIRLIGDVFGSVDRADGIGLHEGCVIDSYGSSDEQAQARLLDTDVCWEEISDDDLWAYHSGFFFMDAKGFRYYLPAYMTWLLKDFRKPDDDPWCWIVLFQLIRDSWPISRFDILDHDQSHAVYRFLRFLAEYGDEQCAADAQEALARYWGRFSDPTSQPAV